jgi:NADH:ubiquinone oxidoreductase subunit 3 (subunit A)
MVSVKILLSPPIVFVVALGIGLLLYWLGRAMAPKTNMTSGKAAPYACGEDAPMAKAQMSYRLFYSLAIFFTVLHVAALVVATLPTGPLAALGFVYLAIIVLAVFALVTK